MIVRGEIEMHRTFSENEIAEQFEFSRTPVREAVAILVREGLLDQIPQVGIKVHDFSEDEINDLLDTRQMIETQIAGRFADRPPKQEDITVLRKLIEEMQQAANQNDRQQFLESDARFHTEIAQRARFSLAAEVLERISDKIRIVGLRALFRHDGMDDVLAEHQAIVEALDRHDHDAALKAMDEHLARTRRRLEESCLEQKRQTDQ
jgi:DNA-binding GntR family transcriptional regulator